jgi:hypothetical protein
MMKICPQCHDEFLESIERCASCNVSLVSHFEAQAIPKKEAIMSKEDLLKDAAVFIEAGLNQCLELEKVLLKAKIACGVYPATQNCENDAKTLGATCDMKYFLLVKASELEGAKNALEGQFIAQVAKEGQGHFVTDVVNLDENIITCPACGESNELKDGECPICGLCLAVESVHQTTT